MGSDVNNNRRLFERVDANGMQIDWHLEVDATHPHDRHVSKGSKATVLDVSVGSARIFTYFEPTLPVGAEVVIGHEGSLGLVRMMSVSREGHASSMQCGVDYIDLEQGLLDYLLAPIRAAQHAALGEIWEAPK
jgi:hypothetical protein